MAAYHPRRRDEVILAPASDEGAFLLDPVSGEYFALDAVGRIIWEHCDGNADPSAIIAAVRAAFSDAPEDVADDVEEMLEEFARAGLIVGATGT